MVSCVQSFVLIVLKEMREGARDGWYVGDGGGEILWAALLLSYYVVLMMLFIKEAALMLYGVLYTTS